MSAQPDGTTRCDRCGTDVGNGGIDRAVVAADHTASGGMVTYHFCRENGCARTVLGKANLKARKESGQEVGVATP
jgi:hypothetical protein